MLRLMSACLWCLTTTFFVVVVGIVVAHQNLPPTWAGFLPAQVLGDATASATTPDAPPLAPESSDAGVLAAQARTADARAVLVANFIERNDPSRSSPLQPYDEWGKLFVSVADEYSLDFRLLPAIARKESTFCKSNIAQTYYNCFGYGVPASGITEAGKFSSFEEGIRTVARSLKKSYIDQGLTDPVAIMAKYCPPSAEGAGTWAQHLNQWLAEMRFDDKNLARSASENADLTEFVP